MKSTQDERSREQRPQEIRNERRKSISFRKSLTKFSSQTSSQHNSREVPPLREHGSKEILRFQHQQNGRPCDSRPHQD